MAQRNTYLCAHVDLEIHSPARVRDQSRHQDIGDLGLFLRVGLRDGVCIKVKFEEECLGLGAAATRSHMSTTLGTCAEDTPDYIGTLGEWLIVCRENGDRLDPDWGRET